LTIRTLALSAGGDALDDVGHGSKDRYGPRSKSRRDLDVRLRCTRQATPGDRAESSDPPGGPSDRDRRTDHHDAAWFAHRSRARSRGRPEDGVCANLADIQTVLKRNLTRYVGTARREKLVELCRARDRQWLRLASSHALTHRRRSAARHALPIRAPRSCRRTGHRCSCPAACPTRSGRSRAGSCGSRRSWDRGGAA
jgi:hypothetical protein